MNDGRKLMAAALMTWSGAASAQTQLDRVDPARIEQQLPADPAPPPDASTVPQPGAPAPRLGVSRQVTVGAIVLEGLEALRPSEFADLFERYVGLTLSPDELGGLVDAIAKRARDRGYVLATASIPPQPVAAGVLRVRVDEGRIDEIRLAGGDNASARRSLAPLAGAGPVRLADLERRLLIAGDIDGVTVRRTRFLQEGGRNILVVDLAQQRVTGLVGLANDGSRPIGPVQADARIRINRLLASDDVLALSVYATPFQPDEFLFGSARYTKRVTNGGTELSINGTISATQPGAYLQSRDLEGRRWTAGLGLLHPLQRRRDTSLWLEGSLSVRRTEQDRRDVLTRRDRLTVARGGLYGFSQLAGGRLRVNATVARGLDLFDATRAGDPLASRRDADGEFTAAYLWTDWTGPVAAGFTANVAVAAQVADQPLLSSEEVGLGGGAFLRGYDYGERSGDQGAMVSAELRRQLAKRIGLVRRPELYAFVDGGRVTNLREGFGTGTLFSAGGGVRFNLTGRLTADVGLAVPLSGERYDSGNSDPVVNFRILKRF